tara:strand:+ start:2880 stop:3728 length:849 start_codon:yes stop_codon:yes gene_type:complete
MTYNERSAKKWGWDPSWFGAAGFGPELKDKIKAFQQEHDLDVDGLCGPSTYRRKFTERLSLEKSEEYIVCNGLQVPINWGKVILWNEPGGLKAPSGTYRKVSGTRDVKMFVNHWDVCLNSHTCHKVLKKRKLSVHFLVDNDGTIYQTMDTNDVGYHAGRSRNKDTIGVEISNAYYTKYQSWYERKGFGPRPIVKGAKVHGRSMREHLGFYPVQVEAMKALWAAVAKGHNIPLVTPTKEDGSEWGGVYRPAVKGTYRGFIHHYNITDGKIDCGGWDITPYFKR